MHMCVQEHCRWVMYNNDVADVTVYAGVFSNDRTVAATFYYCTGQLNTVVDLKYIYVLLVTCKAAHEYPAIF